MARLSHNFLCQVFLFFLAIASVFKTRVSPKWISFQHPLTGDDSRSVFNLFFILAHMYLLVKLSRKKWIKPEFFRTLIFSCTSFIEIFRWSYDKLLQRANNLFLSIISTEPFKVLLCLNNRMFITHKEVSGLFRKTWDVTKLEIYNL